MLIGNSKKKGVAILCFVLCFLAFESLEAQSFWFGPKGGIGLSTQQGIGANSQAALTGHYGLFIETYSEEESPGSFYASLGMHQRGSGSRAQFTFDNFFVPGFSVIYNNLSLQVGVKKFTNEKFYYMVGIRGEYTVYTNIEELAGGFSSAFFPIVGFVNPLTGGISGGVGYQYNLADLFGAAIEVSVHPDFFNQYRSPEIPGVTNPLTGQTINIREKAIRNTTLEVSVYFRFLRKVIYY